MKPLRLLAATAATAASAAVASAISSSSATPSAAAFSPPPPPPAAATRLPSSPRPPTARHRRRPRPSPSASSEEKERRGGGGGGGSFGRGGVGPVYLLPRRFPRSSADAPPPPSSLFSRVVAVAAAIDSDVVDVGGGAPSTDSDSAAAGLDDDGEEEEGEENLDRAGAAVAAVFSPESILRSSLLDAVSVALDNLRRKRSSLEVQASKSSEAERVASRARLISTNLHLLPPGTTSAIVQDWDDGGSEVELILDQGGSSYGSAREEADDLFVRARRMRKGVEVAKGLLEELEHSERILRDAERDLESSVLRGDGEGNDVDGEGVAIVRDRLIRTASDTGFRMPRIETDEGDGKASRQTMRSRRSDPPRRRRRNDVNPRKFLSPSGIPILVGRNRRDNEHLSFVACRPADVWMHARGHAGAHVLLRIRRDGPTPTDEDYQCAADLAAFYSDARTERKAEVTCAEPKHVLKPRGAPLGAVKVRRELPSRIGRPMDVPEEIKAAREESGFGDDEGGRKTFGGKARARARTRRLSKENQAKRRAEKRGEKKRRNKGGGGTGDDDGNADADADWY